AQVHLRHLNPLPHDLGEILARYDKVLVPEMNLGQLSMLLRARYLVDTIGYNRVNGMPLKAAELAEAIGELVAQAEDIGVDLTPAPEEAISWARRTWVCPGCAAAWRASPPPTSRRQARSSPATRRSAGARGAATTPS